MKISLYVIIAITMTQPSRLSPAEVVQLFLVIVLNLLPEYGPHVFGKTTAIMGTILVSLLVFHRIMRPTGDIVHFVKGCIIMFAYSFAAGAVYSYIFADVDRNRCV